MPAVKRPARSPNGYTWDDVLRRYRGPNGRIVSRQAVRDAIDVALHNSEMVARSLTIGLRDGSVTLAEWEIEMRALVKDVQLYSAAAVRGGWDRLTPGDLGRVGQLTRTQYMYLDNFASQLASGEQALNGFALQRSMMYAQAGRGTFEAFAQSDVRREASARGGRVEVRNVLGDAQHCDECAALTRRGWVADDGSMPLPGHRTCKSRCHCHVERRIVGGGDPTMRDDAPPIDPVDELTAAARAALE